MLPHRFAATAAALAVVIAVAVAASPAARHVLSQRDAAPAGWSTIRPASPTARVHFQVAMQQSNLDRLEATLAEVSDPNHARYGKYLTSAQVQALTATPRESARVVEAAFRGFDCHSLGDSLRCAGVVADVERMFGVTMHVFRHDATGVYRRGTLGVFSVDASLRDHVVFVDGLSNFFEPKRVKKPQPVTAGEDYVIIPETLRTLYNITDQVGSADVIQAAAEFGAADYNFSYTDLALFSKSVGVPIDIVNIIGEGANDPGQFSIEATLDVQYVGAIGRGNTNWFVKTPEWMYTFATHLVNTTKRPGVISMSYGWNEQKNCNIADGECRQLDVKVAQYIARVNTEFQKVGTLGTTLLASSGDSGCHGRTDKICLFNAKMYPAFPAASPFVTAVGGTMLKGGGNGPANSSIPICTSSGCATGGQEVVCTTENHQAEITSGGGFSAFAPRPQWQDAVVSKCVGGRSGRGGRANSRQLDSTRDPCYATRGPRHRFPCHSPLPSLPSSSLPPFAPSCSPLT